jgi:Ca2+-binding EF-hand superfamily protein
LEAQLTHLSATQITKADYEKHSHHSTLFKTLDKNKDGRISAHEIESKAEMAFKVSLVTDGKNELSENFAGTGQGQGWIHNKERICNNDQDYDSNSG